MADLVRKSNTQTEETSELAHRLPRSFMDAPTSPPQKFDSIHMGQLLPDFHSISNGFPSTGAELSAWFVTLLVLLTAFFLAFSLHKFRQTCRRVRFVQNTLQPLDRHSVAEHRHVLTEQTAQDSTIGTLWRQFDQTLIEHERQQKLYLSSTCDAACFFNPSTLAPGLADSRLLAAVPGFLTALGVIGTFAGLQLGLSGLNISGNVSVEQMKAGVSEIINGARFAFLTSVWGVTLSVIFNLTEKSIERLVRRRITHLQYAIDALFTRISAEEQLERIANDSEQTRRSLQELAEKIGDRMQVSLFDAVAGVQSSLETSLEKIMSPAINTLVDETSDSNQKALDQLLERFMDRFGVAGDQQRQAIEKSSQGMHAALHSLGNGLDTFVHAVSVTQERNGQREKELVNNMAEQVGRLSQTTTDRHTELMEFIGRTTEQLVRDLRLRDEANSEQDKVRATAWLDQVLTLKQQLSELSAQINKGQQAQLDRTAQLLEQGQQLQGGIIQASQTGLAASQAMQTGTRQLTTTSTHLHSFAQNLDSATTNISEAVSSAVASTAELANLNRINSREMHLMQEGLVEQTTAFNGISVTMERTVAKISENLDASAAHQTECLAGLKQSIGSWRAKWPHCCTNTLKKPTARPPITLMSGLKEPAPTPLRCIEPPSRWPPLWPIWTKKRI